MMKKIFTYFFAFLVIVTTIAPSSYFFSDTHYDLEQYENHEEESQENKMGEDFKEFKIHQTFSQTTFYNDLVPIKQPVFKAKSHTSNYLILDTPPPEFVA